MCHNQSWLECKVKLMDLPFSNQKGGNKLFSLNLYINMGKLPREVEDNVRESPTIEGKCLNIERMLFLWNIIGAFWNSSGYEFQERFK